MRRFRSTLIVLLLAGALAAALYYALRPRPVPAEVATVSSAAIETSVEAEARTRVRDPYVVAAPVSGRLGRIELREGERVRAGSLIASIDPLPATASVQEALAQLEEVRAHKAGVETLRTKAETIAQAQARQSEAQAAYAQTLRDLRRARSLAASGDIPYKQLEAAELAESSRREQLRAARAAVAEVQAKRSDPDYWLRVYDAQAASLEARLRTLEDQASRTTILAPVSGTVLRVLQRSETTVPAGTALVQIANLRNLEIVADVLSEDAVGMRPGNAIVIERGAGPTQLRGYVTVVEPAARTKVSALGVEEQRVDVIGRFTSLPSRIGDQYRLDVRIITWKGSALRIPTGALFRCGDSWCAFKVEGGRARRVPVTLGHRGVDASEVVGGLRSGDRVVVHPSDRVADGTELALRER